jgi:8-oxo-dGTP pyrophosphatase MutT (NUDIX family)
LLIFNIEPKAEGRLQRIYPTAQITIPGGSMEPVDQQSFDRCARREFLEETGINLDDHSVLCTKEIKLKKIGRNNKLKFTHFKTGMQRSRAGSPGDNIHFVFMFYLLHIGREVETEVTDMERIELEQESSEGETEK